MVFAGKKRRQVDLPAPRAQLICSGISPMRGLIDALATGMNESVSEGRGAELLGFLITLALCLKIGL